MAHTPKRLRKAQKALDRHDFRQAQALIGPPSRWAGRDHAKAWLIAFHSMNALTAIAVRDRLHRVGAVAQRAAESIRVVFDEVGRSIREKAEIEWRDPLPPTKAARPSTQELQRRFMPQTGYRGDQK